ncbi:GNAT family N-acetyltransferase [Aquisalimonas sp.]|uniref:GNAT family N-acetyltransferase n=1 Tax=Aquisalimonas sp. TaxID=1872621 RepID=UPI0025BA5E65|nr:GNAT family N-acetyltransferase [Aquisalimonas sp.]
MGDLRFERLYGAGLGRRLDDIARLRMTVFREWPYLYEGDEEYERRFLQIYVDSPRSFALTVLDGDAVVGVTTAMPLTDEEQEIQQPFVDAGIDVQRVFYFAESVLLPEYRGHGLYRQFFREREALAGSFGDYDRVAFCAVQRPDDHPMKPANHQPLDPVWRHFGYQPRPELVAYFPWPDIGEREETQKPLQFWLKPLG